ELGDYWILTEDKKSKIIEKLLCGKTLLDKIAEIEKGSTSGKNDVFTISKDIIKKYDIEKDLLRKNVKNGDISRYGIYDRETYLIYIDKNTDIASYPNTLKYLNEHKSILLDRNEVKKGSYEWWRLERPRRKEIFDSQEKIIVPYRATNNRFAYDSAKMFNDGGDIRVIVLKDDSYLIKYILGLLNSRLIDWYFGFIGKSKGKSREYFNEPLSKIPIASTEHSTQLRLSELVDSIINQNYSFQKIQSKFLSLLKSKFELEKLSQNLQNWDELEFKDFLKELKKKKVELKLSEEAEWMNYFNEQKAKALEIKAEIDKTDKEIDQMVYELYELTPEEIRIVEGV
ncbi:MAG: TaqI-like C-terminal specificity domain-containing protein, partial [Nitrosopumilaceae archaeon]